MSNKLKGRVIKAVALVFDILPPFIATLTQFPIWIEESAEATVSGIFVVLAFLSIIPLIKHVKSFIKSPSIVVLWLLGFLMLKVMQSIIDEMVLVCFVGTISNAIGMLIYKVGEAVSSKEAEA
jgi:hypothetical protein